jgi:hypothetical protein
MRGMRFGIKDVIRRSKKSGPEAGKVVFGALSNGLSSFPAVRAQKK